MKDLEMHFHPYFVSQLKLNMNIIISNEIDSSHNINIDAHNNIDDCNHDDGSSNNGHNNNHDSSSNKSSSIHDGGSNNGHTNSSSHDHDHDHHNDSSSITNIDVDSMKIKDQIILCSRMKHINQELYRKPYLIKKRQCNGAHNGLSLHITIQTGHLSIHFYSNIIHNRENPNEDHIKLQQLVTKTCADVLNRAYREDPSYIALCEFYRTHPSMSHLAEFPGTPCTNIYWSVERHGYNVHTDPNMVGPTFIFHLESPIPCHGGELTFVEFKYHDPLIRAVEMKVPMKHGEVIAGGWDHSYHFNQEYTGNDLYDFHSVVVMYMHLDVLTQNCKYNPDANTIRDEVEK